MQVTAKGSEGGDGENTLRLTIKTPEGEYVSPSEVLPALIEEWVITKKWRSIARLLLKTIKQGEVAEAFNNAEGVPYAKVGFFVKKTPGLRFTKRKTYEEEIDVFIATGPVETYFEQR